jgi:DNA-binding beta-propeller fold protein YncE
LTERWAYCLDLPDPFGTGPAAAHAIAVSPDGAQLAVVDITTGHLAYADTTDLTTQNVVAAPKGAGAASLILGERVFVGVGTALSVLDRRTAAVTASWSVPGAIRGLGVSRDGARVYAGAADQVVWLDAASGKLLGRAPVADLLEVRHVR